MSNIPTMETVCSDANMNKALISCQKKKRTPGPDNMRSGELAIFWADYKSYIKKLLLQGHYHPMQAQKICIPKPEKSGKREIAVLTMLDKMIQKALNYVLIEYYEPLFHESSYGYRGKRTPEDALHKILLYFKQGYKYVVSIDIERYFDNINHKLLMTMIEQDIKDDRITILIRRYLKQQLLDNGTKQRKKKGVIQGAPISPLLANIYLNVFDWYMEELNFKFVRYADDILLFASQKKEAEAIMNEVQKYLNEKLFLKVNVDKSKICEPQNCVFLGYQIVKQDNGKYDFVISKRNKEKILRKIQSIISNMSNHGEQFWNLLGGVHRGWLNYFRLSMESDLIPFLKEVQREEMRLLKQKIKIEQEKGNFIPQTSFPLSKGFVFLLDWLPSAVSKRKQVSIDE